MKIGVQSLNVIDDAAPAAGFRRFSAAGFSCCDFGLNGYLKNTDLYGTAGPGQRKLAAEDMHSFFDRTEEELAHYFQPIVEAAAAEGIEVNQMHMPYPVYVPGAGAAVNTYLREVVAKKSLYICHLFACRYIVVHGFKLRKLLGSEGAEWEKTEGFLSEIAPLAKEYGITLCVENLYESAGTRLVEGPCCDAALAAERIDHINDRFGAEVLGFCFDTGHANVVGLDFYDFLTTLGRRLKVLHIHDNDGISDLHQIPFTFTRERNNRPSTDWEGFIAGLAAADFDGVLNFETAPVLKSFPPELQDQALTLIAQVGAYFSKRIEKEKKRVS